MTKAGQLLAKFNESKNEYMVTLHVAGDEKKYRVAATDEKDAESQAHEQVKSAYHFKFLRKNPPVTHKIEKTGEGDFEED